MEKIKVRKCAESDGKCFECDKHCMTCKCWMKGLISYEDWLNNQPERLNPETSKEDMIV